jgi:hypothetical protein
LGIDAEVGGVLANILNRTLDVAEGVGMAVTAADETRMEDVGPYALYAVLQDEGSNALALQPLGNT